MNRPSIDSVAMATAITWAKRSTCMKKQVGAVILDPHGRIVSTGYNGAPHGMTHCEEHGCLLDERGDCVRSVHAEVNAILRARPEDVEGSVLYTTHFPCDRCAPIISQAGIEAVYYLEDRPMDGVRERAKVMMPEYILLLRPMFALEGEVTWQGVLGHE